MKSLYFTPGTIQQVSRQMLQDVDFVKHGNRSIVFKPEQAALLVLDMQEYFLVESSHAFVPSAPAILTRVSALNAAFQDCGRPVIFTRHENTPEDAGLMAVWWHDLIDPDSPLARIVARFDTSACTVIRKHQYDAFYGTDLEARLRAAGASQVVISGVMTHLCCETTARSAFMRGFQVFFCVDGTATYHEAFHRATILNLAHGFALPVLTDEILADLAASKARCYGVI